jgi:hypothetical protein
MRSWMLYVDIRVPVGYWYLLFLLLELEFLLRVIQAMLDDTAASLAC